MRPVELYDTDSVKCERKTNLKCVRQPRVAARSQPWAAVAQAQRDAPKPIRMLLKGHRIRDFQHNRAPNRVALARTLR